MAPSGEPLRKFAFAQDRGRCVHCPRGPLPASQCDNAAVVLIDHQVGLCSVVRDIPVGELKHNVVALAKAAQVFHLPMVVTATAAESMWGPVIPELADVLPRNLAIIDSSTVNR